VAQIERRLGKPDAAIGAYKEALQLQREIGDKRGIGSTLINLGLVHEGRGAYEDALALYKESLQLQRDTNNERSEALCLNNIGNIYLFKGQYGDAQTNFERALQIRERLNVPADTAVTLHNLAETSKNLGRFDQSQAYYLRALELYRKAGDRRSTAIESYSLGTLFESQGRYGAALASKAEALKTFRDLKDGTSWMPEIVGGYGHALILAGRSQEGAPLVAEALQLARDLKNQPLVAQALDFEGERLFYDGDFSGAAAQFEQALAAASRTTDRTIVLTARVNAAKVSLRDGRTPIAAAALKALADEADVAGLKYLSTECSVYYAEALIEAHDARRARQELERALAKGEKLGARMLMARAHYLLAAAVRKTDAAESRRHYADAARLLDEMRADIGRDEVLKRRDVAQMASESALALKELR
jgi:tetratricopeptide (TPR) repeat protein